MENKTHNAPQVAIPVAPVWRIPDSAIRSCWMTTALWLSLAVDVQQPPSEEQHSVREEDHYLDLRVSPGWQAFGGVGRWRWSCRIEGGELQDTLDMCDKLPRGDLECFVLAKNIPMMFGWSHRCFIWFIFRGFTINFAAEAKMLPASCQVEALMWVVVAMHYGLILLVLMWIKVLFLHIHNMTDTMRHETWLFCIYVWGVQLAVFTLKFFVNWEADYDGCIFGALVNDYKLNLQIG